MIKHYLLWEHASEPDVDKEKYVWLNDGNCKIWNGIRWVIINDGTNNWIDDTLLSPNIARVSDILNYLRMLRISTSDQDPDGDGPVIDLSDYATKKALEDGLAGKLDKTEFERFRDNLNPKLINITENTIRIDNLEDDVNSLWDKINNCCNGSGSDDESGEGDSSDSYKSRVFLIYTKTASPSIVPFLPTETFTWVRSANELNPKTSKVTTSSGNTCIWRTDNKNASSGEYVWISMGSFGPDGKQIGTWTDPFCITSGGKDGKDGRNGVDGVNMEFIYKRVTTLSEAYAEPAPNGDPTVDDWYDEENGWYDHPNGIEPELPIELVSYRKKLGDGSGDWGPFSKPVIWAKWGDDGTDGDGVEYIFLVIGNTENETSVEEVTLDNGATTYKLVDETLWPPINEEMLTSVASVSRELILADFQNDEWVPGNNKQSVGWDRNWTDEPLDVSSAQPFEFVSKRKWNHKTNTWGYFSVPVLWNKFAYVAPSGFTAFAFTRTNKDIRSYVPEGGTKLHPIPTSTKIDSTSYDTDITWSDSIPSGNETVWMTRRIFGDGAENQGWTSPSRLTDNSGFNVEYSNDYDWENRDTKKLPKIDGNPSFVTDNDEGFNESAWRTYCSENGLGTWSDDDTIDSPEFMATCVKGKNGSWSNWVISHIKGEAATEYKWFRIYIASVNRPNTPTTGKWNVEQDVLENIPEGWSVTSPTDRSITWWASDARFESRTGGFNQIWCDPYPITANAVTVSNQSTYYRADTKETGVTAPIYDPTGSSYDNDPTNNGWAPAPGLTTNKYDSVLTSAKPYLWSFQRIKYSNDNVYTSPAVIIRYYNAAANVEYQQVLNAANQAIIDALSNSESRLYEINETATKIENNSGFYSILTQSIDGNNKSFADLVIDSADNAKIQLAAGTNAGGYVSTRLDGIDSTITTLATKQELNDVSASVQTISNDAIQSAVTKSHYVWKGTLPENEVVYKEYLAASGTSDYNKEAWFIGGNYPSNVSSWTRVLLSDEASVIKQTSNSILMAVGDGTNVAASIQVLKSLEVRDENGNVISQPDSSNTSAIVLDADHIILNGEVVANAINTKYANVAGGAVVLDANGLRATNAVIEGDITATTGKIGAISVDSAGLILRDSSNIPVAALVNPGTIASDKTGVDLIFAAGPSTTITPQGYPTVLNTSAFKVYSDGSVKASDFEFNGGSITGDLILGENGGFKSSSWNGSSGDAINITHSQIELRTLVGDSRIYTNRTLVTKDYIIVGEQPDRNHSNHITISPTTILKTVSAGNTHVPYTIIWCNGSENYYLAIVNQLPSSPDSNTIYFVTS